MEHGIVKDWNDMERIWQYVYSKDQLQTFSEEVRPMCMDPSPVLHKAKTTTKVFCNVRHQTTCFPLSHLIPMLFP